MGFIDALTPIYRMLPTVRSPDVEPTLKKKLIWTSIVLVLFFVLGKIQLVGLTAEAASRLGGLEIILASQIGSLITAGIGPIVLSSIILQLLVGGGLIGLNLSDPSDRAKFQGIQKLFAIVLCFFEGFVYPMTGMLQPAEGMLFFVGLQIALGSLMLLYLDEIVSKHGLGSGIGLFIAGGVSATFFWRVFMLPGITAAQPSGGLIPTFILNMFSGGADFLLLLPVIMAVLIFMLIVYAEGMHVNIPITMGRKGTGGRYPVKLLYVSNMPVILAVALFANLQVFAMVVKDVPYLGAIGGAITYATTSQYNLLIDVLVQISVSGFEGLAGMSGTIIQGLIYLIVLVTTCIIFGKFWVELGGQGPKAVAKQLQNSGMYIPGFRRDERIIERILNRYIPPITILGSIFVGLLAGVGDMVLGGISSGTGILLTVGIIYRLYEELAKQHVSETHPLLGKLLG